MQAPVPSESPGAPAERLACPLCGSDISLAAMDTRSEGWKAVAQELVHASPPGPRVRQPLVRPGFLWTHAPAARDGRLVHSACWKIAARLWGRSAVTAAELNGFVDCVRDVAPFLPRIVFGESPEQLDVTIDHRLDADDLRDRIPPVDDDAALHLQRGLLSREGLTPPSLMGVMAHELPPRLEHFVAKTLRDGAQVRRSPDPDPRFWAEVVSMLANSPAPQFARDAPDRPSRIAQALRNLRLGGPRLFPRTANFDIVRANALTVLVTLVPIPVEDLDARDPVRRPRLLRPRTVQLAAVSRAENTPFRLNFLTLRRPCGAHRAVALGMKYLRLIDFDASRPVAETDLIPQIAVLPGIRLIRDAVGVVAVHARDGDDWLSVWQQDASTPLTTDMSLKVTTAEWVPGVDDAGHLTVVADTAKDLTIAVQTMQQKSQTSLVEMDGTAVGFHVHR